LNYARLELGGAIGEQTFKVESGGDKVVSVALPEANRLLSLRLARHDASGGWKKLRSTSLAMTAELRVLVFLFEDSQRPGRTEMVLLRDRVEPEPSASPEAP
jgi:hypothetical protein